MHELSIAEAIRDAVLGAADGRRVTAVNLRVGALRQVVPPSLDFYFEIVSRDSLCEGARLHQEQVAALMGCAECGREWDPAPAPAEEESELVALPSFRCPDCGAGGATVLAGEELDVDTIDVVDEEEEPCTAPG